MAEYAIQLKCLYFLKLSINKENTIKYKLLIGKYILKSNQRLNIQDIVYSHLRTWWQVIRNELRTMPLLYSWNIYNTTTTTKPKVPTIWVGYMDPLSPLRHVIMKYIQY